MIRAHNQETCEGHALSADCPDYGDISEKNKDDKIRWRQLSVVTARNGESCNGHELFIASLRRPRPATDGQIRTKTMITTNISMKMISTRTKNNHED